MGRPPGMQDVRFRWWWIVAAIVFIQPVVLTLPLWLMLLVPFRYGGFPTGVGRIGGLPKTAYGRWYGASPVWRAAVWVVASAVWVVAVSQVVADLPASEATTNGFSLAASLPVGFGWWWHVERVLGRRRLARFLRDAPTERANAPSGAQSPMNGLRSGVPLSDLPPMRVTEQAIPDAERLGDITTAPPPHVTSTFAPGGVTAPAVHLRPDDLRRNRPGVTARKKAEEERAAGKPERTVRNWLTGAEGEETVAATLARLPQGWTVIHDLPIGLHGANVDHVVIGPAGVFTLNTKHHRGAVVKVNGPSVIVREWLSDHVQKAREEASRTSELLTRALGYSVAAQPVLVFVGIKDVVFGDQPCPVLIANDQNIRATLTTQPPSTPLWRVNEISEAAARPSTWKQPTYGLGPGGSHHRSGRRNVSPMTRRHGGLGGGPANRSSAPRGNRELWRILGLVAGLYILMQFLAALS